MQEERKHTTARREPSDAMLYTEVRNINSYRVLSTLRYDIHTYNVKYGFNRKKPIQEYRERKVKLELLKRTSEKLDKAIVHINNCWFDYDYEVSKTIFVALDMLRNKYAMFEDIDTEDLIIPIETINEYHKSIIPSVDSVLDKYLVDTQERIKAKHPYYKPKKNYELELRVVDEV